jgi:hypothetical protein
MIHIVLVTSLKSTLEITTLNTKDKIQYNKMTYGIKVLSPGSGRR